ncbi:intradiol ring-cleavage dioxygenase [Streptomyces sp. S3(2020)]|uniref:intradiol ring-cleavage dioxygenase n=1 Tax=Streptomyces sp. S3(2020) TaxID=2732044 RepID=UPI001489B8C1|nr:intradiol ring-cleavage dioxygenase [Streptomyces sp. S3(2020)]NNN29132.1 intradiol ring-cleavage dioxygenase [Streptomyces sp. S3(2020)]
MNNLSLFSEEKSAEVVLASFGEGTDPRLRHVLGALVRYLHDFVKEVELTNEEWEAAIGFLTETGQTCTNVRQEFILLSDVLGVSMLVETVNNRSLELATESTVLGPFHMVDSPIRERGDTIALDGKGRDCLVTGRVTNETGAPLANATVDVWQANAEGFYDVQQPDVQPEGNLRGLFTTDDNGEFWFRSIVPRHYPIPVDGPVGRLLQATGRHPHRPAHVHFLATAKGHRPLVTHLFVEDCPYLGSDVVFGVKESLVREFAEVDDPSGAAELGFDNPYCTVHFDVALLSKPEPK